MAARTRVRIGPRGRATNTSNRPAECCARRYTFSPSARIFGFERLAHTALDLDYQTEEAMEGRNAFVEKRPVDFKKFRR